MLYVLKVAEFLFGWHCFAITVWSKPDSMKMKPHKRHLIAFVLQTLQVSEQVAENMTSQLYSPLKY